MKAIFNLLYEHMFTLFQRRTKLFITRFNTLCQTVTPLLYCACTMARSDVAHSANNREHCVSQCHFIKADRRNA